MQKLVLLMVALCCGCGGVPSISINQLDTFAVGLDAPDLAFVHTDIDPKDFDGELPENLDVYIHRCVGWEPIGVTVNARYEDRDIEELLPPKLTKEPGTIIAHVRTKGIGAIGYIVLSRFKKDSSAATFDQFITANDPSVVLSEFRDRR